MPLAPLDNQVVFRKLFQDPDIIKVFAKDLIGMDIDPQTIEVEKHIASPIGTVEFDVDVYVEDPKQQVVLEIHQICQDYDYNRFLYYNYATTLEIGRAQKFYKLDRTVYTIVWLTAPSDNPMFQHGIVTTGYQSTAHTGEVLPLFSHSLRLLNPHYVSKHTPKAVAEWMQLMLASMSESPQPAVESEREIFQKAVALIDEDQLTPQEREQMQVVKEKDHTKQEQEQE